jgi:GntR family histidine utilization transcriptional repressor
VIREEITRTGAQYRYALIGRDKITAARRLSAEYGFPAGQDVLHLECMHYANDEPFQYEERWINLAAVPTARDADFSKIGPNDWLVQEVPFTDAVISFRAVRPSSEVADLLGSTDREAHFLSERTTRLHGETVTLARLIFHFGYQVTSKI